MWEQAHLEEVWMKRDDFGRCRQADQRRTLGLLIQIVRIYLIADDLSVAGVTWSEKNDVAFGIEF